MATDRVYFAITTHPGRGEALRDDLVAAGADCLATLHGGDVRFLFATAEPSPPDPHDKMIGPADAEALLRHVLSFRRPAEVQLTGGPAAGRLRTLLCQALPFLNYKGLLAGHDGAVTVYKTARFAALYSSAGWQVAVGRGRPFVRVSPDESRQLLAYLSRNHPDAAAVPSVGWVRPRAVPCHPDRQGQ
jgi:hypothetical protein